MWTPTTRAQHSRTGLRHGSDLTDAEWDALSPFLPPACRRAASQVANAEDHQRDLLCPAWQLRLKHAAEVLSALADGLSLVRLVPRPRDMGGDQPSPGMLDRERAGPEASPTAAVIASQSVKTTESGCVRRYDGEKKINGRKRHAMLDTDARALELHADSAAIPDRDGVGPLTAHTALQEDQKGARGDGGPGACAGDVVHEPARDLSG